MNSFQEGKKLFAIGDLSGSYGKLKLFLNENLETASADECVESAKLILNIAKIQSINEEDYINIVARAFIKGRNYREACHVLEKFITNANDFIKEQHFELLIECAKNIGSVKKEKKYHHKLIDYLLKKGSADKVINCDNRYTSVKDRLEAFVKSYDIEAVERLILSDESKNIEVEFFISHLSKNSVFWNKSLALREWLIEKLSNETSSFAIKKKYVLKLLYDHLIQGEDIDYKVLINICEKWRLFSLGYEASKLAGDKDKEDYFLINMPNELMKDESFDFGSDLLESKVIKASVKYKVNEDKGDVRRNIDQLLNEIQTITRDDIAQNIESGLKVFVGDDELSFLKENYNDLIAGLNMLGEYELSRKTLETFLENNDISLEDTVNINYLLVETLLSQKNFFEAERVINDVFFKYPLTKEKRVTFMYLKADAFYLQGKRDKALRYYKIVNEEKPSYRLVKQRLGELTSAK